MENNDTNKRKTGPKTARAAYSPRYHARPKQRKAIIIFGGQGNTLNERRDSVRDAPRLRELKWRVRIHFTTIAQIPKMQRVLQKYRMTTLNADGSIAGCGRQPFQITDTFAAWAITGNNARMANFLRYVFDGYVPLHPDAKRNENLRPFWQFSSSVSRYGSGTGAKIGYRKSEFICALNREFPQRKTKPNWARIITVYTINPRNDTIIVDKAEMVPQPKKKVDYRPILERWKKDHGFSDEPIKTFDIWRQSKDAFNRYVAPREETEIDDFIRTGQFIPTATIEKQIDTRDYWQHAYNHLQPFVISPELPLTFVRDAYAMQTLWENATLTD